MKKPDSNIGRVCENHAPRPNPELAAKDPRIFIGGHVKKRFDTDLPGPNGEHMWVKVHSVVNDELVGELDNEPAYCSNLKNGDPVVVKRDEIEDYRE